MIDDEGNQLGIMTPFDALKIAREKTLDLVEVSPTAQPPVCRIMDYGKFKYEQSKKLQEARRKATTIQVKEIKVRPKIEEHDMNFKLKNTRRFLGDGDKVKISVIFRGREIAHTDRGFRLLSQMAEVLADVGTVESNPKLEGRNLSMIITPK